MGLLTLPTQEEQGTWPQESQGRKGNMVPPPPFLKLRGGFPCTQKPIHKQVKPNAEEQELQAGWSLLCTTAPDLTAMKH